MTGLSQWQLKNKLQAAPSLLYPAEWTCVSSFTLQTSAMTWPLVTKCHERTVSVTAWMMANRQLSFSEWWWGFASLHCHWLRDIHQANTSPTYYIRYHMSREHDTAFDNGRPVTASLLTALVMGDLPRLLYPLTFFSLRQVGGREPGSSQDVTLPLIPNEWG